jgi:hypothetical protein
MDAHAQLDPTLKKQLIAYAEKRFGLLGAFRHLQQIKACQCEPCKAIRTVIEEHS